MPTSCPWSLSALRVPPAQRPRLFDAFAQAIGRESVEVAYGLWPPPHLLELPQRVWRFVTQADHVAGWGALTLEPSEQAAWVSVGVWPAYAGKGVRLVIREQLCAFALAQGVSHLRVGVRLSNTPHLQRCLAESQVGGPWRHVGMVWWPTPGYAIFARIVA